MPESNLASLLVAVERIQHTNDPSKATVNQWHDAVSKLYLVDVKALKGLAHQHAEALRAFARVADEIERPVLNPATSLRAAADFLDGTEG